MLCIHLMSTAWHIFHYKQLDAMTCMFAEAASDQQNLLPAFAYPQRRHTGYLEQVFRLSKLSDELSEET